jgi:hypothetical protein
MRFALASVWVRSYAVRLERGATLQARCQKLEYNVHPRPDRRMMAPGITAPKAAIHRLIDVLPRAHGRDR